MHMVRDWFDTTEAVAFARALALDIGRLYPVGAQKNKATTSRKDQRKLDALVLRTRAFAQQHKLNVYKKAKLLNTIKWEMRDAGQDKELIDQIVLLLTPLLR